MEHVLMECGCVAMAINERGDPVCPIHIGIIEGATLRIDEKPSLEGRRARCNGCGSEPVESNYGLPFFEYMGPGSWTAIHKCANCGWLKNAHPSQGGSGCYLSSNNPLPGLCEHNNGTFRPLSQGMEFDGYYDGCSGWD